MDLDKKRKKILFLISDLAVGGAQRLVIDQISTINRDIFDPYLATLLEGSTKSSLAKIKLSPERIRFFRFPSFFHFSSWISLISWMRKEKFDILYTHLQFANTVGRMVAILVGIKKIISVEHNIYPGKEAIRFITDWVLSLGTFRIIAVSGAVKDFLIKKGRIPLSKIEVIHNGINLSPYPPSYSDRNSLREKFGFKEEEMIILSVGSMSHQKAYDILLEVALKMKRALKKRFRFLIAGYNETDLGRDLKEALVALGLQEGVEFLGLRRDVPELLAAADIFFMPSRWEGFPITVIEAMASGLPLVVSDVGGNTEAVEDEVSGFVVSGNDEEREDKFVARLETLIINKNLRQRMGRNAKKKAEKFSLKENIKRIENTFLA